ncbi:glycoside hydrolase family 20 zincin-like fold domain-containing protein [Pedobacter sp. MW01-1-1]|uniref:glycoside hydrolase family 20 zincin-like fold domain-containing protein n=1 Tax=Pedobacter sp. MW01-1-1 TaxID=3383027 RepID=UPI003FF0EF94
MLKKIFTSTIFSLFIIVTYAQLKLIPTPQHLNLSDAHFNLNNKTQIVAKSVDLFCIEELNACIKKELNFVLPIAKRGKKNSIEFIQLKSDKQTQKLLSENNFSNPEKMGTEGYFLKISPQKISIYAKNQTGFFYGMQTLKQVIKANRSGNQLPTVSIFDYPNIAVRAWQDDISRGPIPSMDMLKKQIMTMAEFKLNYFSLYIEHVFKLKKDPSIAPADGITQEQVAELSQFAKKYHIELIGSYQSFGHMAKTLANPKYEYLRENNHIISPAFEDSYTFLKDVYSEIVPAFSGEYFNINCDETFGLGEGKSKKMMDSIGLGGIYAYHINRLNTILTPFNKKIIMWGDIAVSHPEIIPQLPKDITVIPWAYQPADNFDYAIKPIAAQGLNFWVAPGINCWSNIFPNYEAAKTNIYNFIRDGYALGAKGVFNTSWDDGGLNFFENNWHGFVWGAQNSWKAPNNPGNLDISKQEKETLFNQFNTAYDALFYGLTADSLTKTMTAFSKLHQSDVREILKNNRLFEPIFPIYKDYIGEKQKTKNLALKNQLAALVNNVKAIVPRVKENKITLDYLLFAMKEADFTLDKNLLRVEIDQYLNTKNQNDSAVTAIQTNTANLIERARQLKTEYARLWHLENRDSWLDVNMKQYDQLIQSLIDLEGYTIITPSEKLYPKGRMISMRSLFGTLPVHYSLNQDTVTSQSNLYTKPIYINKDVQIKARVIKQEKAYSISKVDLIYHKAIGKLAKLNSNYSPYHPSYDGGGKYGLLDGKLGSDNDIRSGLWQAYSGQDINIELDLDSVQNIHTFSMAFFQNTTSWVILPKKVEIFAKKNLQDEYTLVQTIQNTIAPEVKGNLRHPFEASFKNLKTRYIKVVAQYYGKLPEWHPAGSKFDCMTFADEIILK